MQAAYRCDVVYVVVVRALARKFVHLFKVFGQARLFHEYDAVTDRFVLRQYALEFIAPAAPAFEREHARRLFVRVLSPRILDKLRPYYTVAFNVHARIIKARLQALDRFAPLGF